MDVNTVTAIYFSPTGNAGKIARHIATTAADFLKVPMNTFDFTLPQARTGLHTYGESDLVVFCMPVYAGRLPNKILPFIQSGFSGNGARTVIVCSYGNRDFQDALMELYKELSAEGFAVFAAAAVPSEHAFTQNLATGRPNGTDLCELTEFTEKALEKLDSPHAGDAPAIPGNDPAGPYYTPLGLDGEPAQFLKAKPKTDPARCLHCGTCAACCSMGAIDPIDTALVPGTCIKCQACVHFCPAHAKYFDDKAFLSHKAMLEKNFTSHKKIQTFL